MTKLKAPPTPEELAKERASYLTGLYWHAGAFVIINVFLWLLDSVGAGGINWAPWITIFWGFGLAFHALAYLIDGRQIERRMSQRYLDEETRSKKQK